MVPLLNQMSKDKNSPTIGAFGILSYIKTLCQHPYFLTDISLERKRDFGIATMEEDTALRQ